MAETSVEVVLALNRCLFFASPNIGHFLFGSHDLGTAHRAWWWMVPPILWGVVYSVREKPLIFSSFQHIETENPHFGYFNDMTENVRHSNLFYVPNFVMVKFFGPVFQIF